MKTLMLIATLLLGTHAMAEGPCKEKRQAKHEARKALRECVEAWAHDNRPDDKDPSDDCSAKTASFVAAAKAVKACHVEMKAKTK